MSEGKKKPDSPSQGVDQEVIDILTNVAKEVGELKHRVRESEGVCEERMVFHAAFTSYIGMYYDRWPNIVEQHAMRETALKNAITIAREAVRVHREMILQEYPNPKN